jgi:hypothetical protein
VKEAAEILNRRPKTAIKLLKAIKARFIEKTVTEKVDGKDVETKVTEFVTEEEAEKLTRQSSQMDVMAVLGDLLVGGNVGAMVSAILAHARTTEKEADIRAIVHGAIGIRPAIEGNTDPKTNERRFSDEVLDSMRAEVLPPVKQDLAYYEATYKAAIRTMSEIQDMFVEAGKPELPTAWGEEIAAVPVAAE